jgi:hypothetical protein
MPTVQSHGTLNSRASDEMSAPRLAGMSCSAEQTMTVEEAEAFLQAAHSRIRHGDDQHTAEVKWRSRAVLT